MKTFVRQMLLSFSLLTLLFARVDAQESCGEQSLEELRQNGEVSYHAGRYEEAVVYYSCAIELDPENSGLYNLRGNAYYYIPDFDAALADYNRAIELSPDTAYLYHNRGNVYYLIGEYDFALADYESCIELDPAYNRVYYRRAKLFVDLERYNEAIEDLDTYISLVPDYADAYLLRASAYIATGNVEPSHADFYSWIQLREGFRINESLELALANGNLHIEKGWVYHLDFEGEAGTSYGFEALSEDEIDPLLVLLSPDGTPIASNDDSRNLNAVINRFNLPETGTYMLLLAQAGASGIGEVELIVHHRLNVNLGNLDMAFHFSKYFLDTNVDFHK